jgi:DNA modification methylase
MTKKLQPTIWDDCYDERWQGFIIPEAMAHPAKFSKGLVERIYDHCLEMGWLRPGDVVGDCFGGVATGGLVAAYRGLAWTGVELEPKFMDLACRNILLHFDKLSQLGKPIPRMAMGDSRKFHELVGCQAVVTSPPYADSVNSSKSGIDWDKAKRPERWGKAETRNGCQAAASHAMKYGDTPGQIGAMKGGDLDVVITSPPYSDISAGAGGLNTKPAKHSGQQTGRNPAAASQSGNWSKDLLRYGNSDGQISKLKGGDLSAVVTSPPFTQGFNVGGGINVNGYGDGSDKVGDRTYQAKGGDRSSGNIETLKEGSVDGVVTSPPWERNCEGEIKRSKVKFVPSAGRGHYASMEARERAMQKSEEKTYGESDGQIGQSAGETYWQAMAQVYASCFLAIKPGGVIAVVVKDYVKAKKRVPLCDDTARLLEHCGFVVVERVHAMLTKEISHSDLFDGCRTQKKERKSFFRRLAEKKGSPAIDFEEVIFAQKPTNAGQP